MTGWRLTPSAMARLSQNESSCEKNQHGMAKPCPTDHITSMSHVLKIERGIFRKRLHETPHIHSFLRFTESRNKLSLVDAVQIKLNVTNTYLHDLPKWSRHFSLYLFIQSTIYTLSYSHSVIIMFTDAPPIGHVPDPIQPTNNEFEVILTVHRR